MQPGGALQAVKAAFRVGSRLPSTFGTGSGKFAGGAMDEHPTKRVTRARPMTQVFTLIVHANVEPLVCQLRFQTAQKHFANHSFETCGIPD